MSGINDFALKLANVNGTGSASANSLLMQAIFRMGIPVSGKNLFPSNIQGLPTWYEIRVNKDGYCARALDYDLMVAMDALTYSRDIQEMRSGGYVLYDSTWPLHDDLYREDLNFLGVPLAKMCNENFTDTKSRILLKNIMYSGVLVALLDIDMELIEQLILDQYGKKKALLEANRTALRLGYEFAKKNFECPLSFRVERMNANADKMLIDGNTATALGAIWAGATVAAWYPITPATSVMDAFKSFCDRYRKDPITKKNNFAFIQAEDELAAIGMVIGASWAGARAFTSTAGPGISLMNELIGMAYYAEIPAVLFDIQRTGPSTGMPTRTQQADILLCAYASHGDTKHILLFPRDPAECFAMAAQSFDLAEHFQTPVFMLSDLDIGMNDWVVDKLHWDPTRKPDHGKVLTSQELDELGTYYRYSPADEDNVAPRTIPGVNAKGSYFTRGSGHNKLGKYTELPEEYKEVVDRLLRKHASAAKYVPAPIIQRHPNAEIALITLGGCDAAVREAVDNLEASGVHCDYMRIRAFPFNVEVEEFIMSHEVCYVIEQNRDAQLKSLLTLETGVPKDRLKSILVYGGFPLSAKHVLDGLVHHGVYAYSAER